MLKAGLVSADHAICDERAVAIVTFDRDAHVGCGRLAGREDRRAAFEIDHLHGAVGARDLKAERLELGDGAQDDVTAVEAAAFPIRLPSAISRPFHHLSLRGQHRQDSGRCDDGQSE